MENLEEEEEEERGQLTAGRALTTLLLSTPSDWQTGIKGAIPCSFSLPLSSRVGGGKKNGTLPPFSPTPCQGEKEGKQHFPAT